MSSLPEPDWQIQNNGQEYGPYSRARILEMLARGELPEAAAIRQAGMAEWLPVPAARGLLQSFQATGGTLAQAEAPMAEEPFKDAGAQAAVEASAEAGHEEGHEESHEAGHEAGHEESHEAEAEPGAETEPEPEAEEESVVMEPAAGADGASPEEPVRRRRSVKAPYIYAAVALLVLAGAWWFFRGGDMAGADGYAKVKEELVHRMDIWREKGFRLEAVPAEAVDGPLVRYTIDPPAGPIGDKETAYTFVIHCTFRDKHGQETQGKVTVTMESKRLRFWNLFSQ